MLRLKKEIEISYSCQYFNGDNWKIALACRSKGELDTFKKFFVNKKWGREGKLLWARKTRELLAKHGPSNSLVLTRALPAKSWRSIKQDFTNVYIGWLQLCVITPTFYHMRSRGFCATATCVMAYIHHRKIKNKNKNLPPVPVVLHLNGRYSPSTVVVVALIQTHFKFKKYNTKYVFHI